MTMKNNEEKKLTIRVLLADDHAVVRAGIRQFLERAGDIQVIGEASDGEMAVEMIERMAPDVAVLDIQMPKATKREISPGIGSVAWLWFRRPLKESDCVSNFSMLTIRLRLIPTLLVGIISAESTNTTDRQNR